MNQALVQCAETRTPPRGLDHTCRRYVVQVASITMDTKDNSELVSIFTIVPAVSLERRALNTRCLHAYSVQEATADCYMDLDPKCDGQRVVTACLPKVTPTAISTTPAHNKYTQ